MANKPITPSGSSAEKYTRDKWVKTGEKWVDGKPIYRRCFSGTATAGKYLIPGTSKIDKIINFGGGGYVNGATNFFVPLGFAIVNPSESEFFSIFNKTGVGVNIQLTYNGAHQASVFEIWIEATLNN